MPFGIFEAYKIILVLFSVDKKEPKNLNKKIAFHFFIALTVARCTPFCRQLAYSKIQNGLTFNLKNNVLNMYYYKREKPPTICLGYSKYLKIFLFFFQLIKKN
jgi:hypothetical protein